MAMVVGPVCGKINPASAVASEAYEGTTYFFCSESRRQRVVAAPEQFAA